METTNLFTFLDQESTLPLLALSLNFWETLSTPGNINWKSHHEIFSNKSQSSLHCDPQKMLTLLCFCLDQSQKDLLNEKPFSEGLKWWGHLSSLTLDPFHSAQSLSLALKKKNA